MSVGPLMRGVLCLSRRAYKTIVEDDLKFPLIYGEGKKVKHWEIVTGVENLSGCVHACLCVCVWVIQLGDVQS